MSDNPYLEERGRLDEVRRHISLVLAAVVVLDETNLLLGVGGRVVDDDIAVLGLDDFFLEVFEELGIVQIAAPDDAKFRVARKSSAADGAADAACRGTGELDRASDVSPLANNGARASRGGGEDSLGGGG